jgi:hypothetical protein
MWELIKFIFVAMWFSGLKTDDKLTVMFLNELASQEVRDNVDTWDDEHWRDAADSEYGL